MTKSYSNEIDSLKIKCIADATEITNVNKTGFSDRRDVVRGNS